MCWDNAIWTLAVTALSLNKGWQFRTVFIALIYERCKKIMCSTSDVSNTDNLCSGQTFFLERLHPSAIYARRDLLVWQAAVVLDCNCQALRAVYGRHWFPDQTESTKVSDTWHCQHMRSISSYSALILTVNEEPLGSGIKGVILNNDTRALWYKSASVVECDQNSKCSYRQESIKCHVRMNLMIKDAE